MPRLSEFYGIVVYRYWKDHNPPHFHDIYAGDEALVRIADGHVPGRIAPADGRTTREGVDASPPGGVHGQLDSCAAARLPPPGRRLSVNLDSVGRPARIIDAEPLGGLRLRLTFSDGLVRELDLDWMLEGGVFESLRDPG